METLLNAALANAIGATVLAAIVLVVTRIWRNPFLAHVLWLLVLVKFITPPIWHLDLPVVHISLQDESHDPVSGESLSATSPLVSDSNVIAFEPVSGSEIERDGTPPVDVASVPPTTGVGPTFAFHRLWMALGFVWLAGILLNLLIVVFRIRRFDRLAQQAAVAPPDWQIRVEQQAAAMGLRRCPEVRLIEASLAPMIWSGRRALLLLPRDLLSSLSEEQGQVVVAHELSHIRRRDHWLRWLEILVSVLYWWHPVVSAARRRLHQFEEECCDASVLALFPDRARLYGEVLLQTARFVSGPPAPALASSFGQAHQLKRRVRMLTQDRIARPLSSSPRLALLFLAAAVLPLSASGDKETISEAPAADPVAQSPAAPNEQPKPKSLRTKTASAQGQTPRPAEPKPAAPARQVEDVAMESGETIEWSLTFTRDNVIITAEKSVPLAYIEKMISMLRKSGKSRVALQIKAVPSDAPTIKIRVKNGDAEVFASRNVRAADLTAVVQQLQAKPVKSITLHQLNPLKNPKKGTPASDDLPPKLDGRITRTDDKPFCVAISLGADDGLRMGSLLDVYRDRTYVGRIKVRRLTPDSAVATILEANSKSPIKRNDRVTTRLIEAQSSGLSATTVIQGVEQRSGIGSLSSSQNSSSTRRGKRPAETGSTQRPGPAGEQATTQVWIKTPVGMKVQWETKPGAYDSPTHVCPMRVTLRRANFYRLKLSAIASHPGIELFPSLEIAPTTPATANLLQHNAVPLLITREDIDQALTGNLVTKVLYQPDPQFQELAIAGVETIASQRLDPGKDPILEADRRGSIIAVLRLGNRQAEVPKIYPLPATRSPADSDPKNTQR